MVFLRTYNRCLETSFAKSTDFTWACKCSASILHLSPLLYLLRSPQIPGMTGMIEKHLTRIDASPSPRQQCLTVTRPSLSSPETMVNQTTTLTSRPHYWWELFSKLWITVIPCPNSTSLLLKNAKLLPIACKMGWNGYFAFFFSVCPVSHYKFFFSVLHHYLSLHLAYWDNCLDLTCWNCPELCLWPRTPAIKSLPHGFIIFICLVFGGIGVWIQGFVFVKQSLYSLSHTSIPFCSGYFGDGVSKTICPVWPWTIILLITNQWSVCP
jgi:hypothetical protein